MYKQCVMLLCINSVLCYVTMYQQCVVTMYQQCVVTVCHSVLLQCVTECVLFQTGSGSVPWTLHKESSSRAYHKR